MENVINFSQLISFQNQYDKEISRRLAIAWNKFWSIRLWLYSHTETEIVDTRVLSRMDTATLCNRETQIACHTHTAETEVS